MEISAIEIHLLCDKVSKSIDDYFVSGIYSMEDGALFRVNHSTKSERLIAVSSFATWITTKNLSIAQATSFVSHLRVLERFALISVEQIGNERIAKFSFESKKGEKRNLFAEFFSRGNLILTDSSSGDKIIDVQNPQSFRHRILKAGEKYILPPSRGVPLQDIDFQKLSSIFNASAKEDVEDLSAIRWFGRNIGTSRKFVQEIFFRAKLNPDLVAKSLSVEDLEHISMACENLRVELQRSEKGYILLPTEESDLEIDVCPIVPNSWNQQVERHLATIIQFPTLSEALDEVLMQAIILERRRSVSQRTRARAAELSSAITKQAAQIEVNSNRADELRIMARNLITSQLEKSDSDPKIIRKLVSYDILELSKTAGNQPKFLTEPRSFLKSYSGTALGSRLFDEAKRLDSETRKIKEIMTGLEMQKETLDETTRSHEEKAERRLITERRERQWFERYRWFLTSDKRLGLGGRDSTSNSVIVNKYTSYEDVVFHADLHGSPFFILKNQKSEKSPPDEIALEMAQATVSFSRAWKDELGSGDAFWVYPDQVKKSAPSGEYLPRGSFFIEGKKNFIRHVKVELSVGIMSSANFPIIEKSSDSSNRDQSTTDSVSLLVVCGPEKSIAKYCESWIRIAPGKEKGSMFARRLKQQLVNKIKDQKEKEVSKKLPLDDFLRVLPSGSYKIVLERQKN